MAAGALLVALRRVVPKAAKTNQRLNCSPPRATARLLWRNRLFHCQMACGLTVFSQDALAITSATDRFVKNGFLDTETLPNRLLKARSVGAKGEPFK